jgi:hypothetical protein
MYGIFQCPAFTTNESVSPCCDGKGWRECDICNLRIQKPQPGEINSQADQRTFEAMTTCCRTEGGEF